LPSGVIAIDPSAQAGTWIGAPAVFVAVDIGVIVPGSLQ